MRMRHRASSNAAPSAKSGRRSIGSAPDADGDELLPGDRFLRHGNWLPALLSGQGASITHSLLYAFFITLAYPLGCLFCTRFVHRFENKWQIVLSALMTVIFGTLFALQNSPILLVICGFMITGPTHG